MSNKMAEEQTQKPKTSRKNLFIGCGIMVVALIITLAVCIGTCGGGSSTETKDLSASVSFDGSQFTIRNNDSFDWRNVEFTLNSDYKLTYPLLSAQSTYTVGAMQFAKNDGEKFNPFTHKVMEMFIACDTLNGRGYYSCGWE